MCGSRVTVAVTCLAMLARSILCRRSYGGAPSRTLLFERYVYKSGGLQRRSLEVVGKARLQACLERAKHRR
jgi:hypothetical protein